MDDRVEVLFFPGKNTPLKRYIPYFKKLVLKIPREEIETLTILCHSKGLENAIQYCKKNNLTSRIVSMDGVRSVVPDDIKVVCFRPEHKRNIGDEKMYHKIIYYETNQETSHYPYMNKQVRDQIVKEIMIDN